MKPKFPSPKVLPERSKHYSLQINFHVTGSLIEHRDETTANLNTQRNNGVGLDITVGSNQATTVDQERYRGPRGLDRASKLNNELLSLLFNEEHGRKEL